MRWEPVATRWIPSQGRLQAVVALPDRVLKLKPTVNPRARIFAALVPGGVALRIEDPGKDICAQEVYDEEGLIVRASAERRGRARRGR